MKNKSLKNIIRVTLSNLTTIIVGILTGFILPKIMEVSDYGYYKTFTLYSTYIGLLSLGIVDGIVLKYGNKDLDELPQKKFRAIFAFFLMLSTFFALIGFIISLQLINGNSKYIFIFISLNIITTNITSYFQQISQITQRFKEYSFRNILKSILNIIIILVLLVLYMLNINFINYKIYIILYLCVNYILSFWYIFTYRDLIFGGRQSFSEIKSEIKELIKIGFPLLFANLCSTLILTLDRQFVNVLYDGNTYAIYAFAYNLLSLVTIATTAISAVIFPSLKRMKKDDAINSYKKYLSIILCFIFFAICSYFPLKIIITYFLPKYISSVEIFRIIFPGLAITSSITIIMQNYYKILNENLLFFMKSIIILIISFIFNLVAYLCFKTPISISIASIFSMIIWFILIDYYFYKKFNVANIKNFIYMLLNIIIFYLCTSIKNDILAMCIYINIFAILTYIFLKKELKQYFKFK